MRRVYAEFEDTTAMADAIRSVRTRGAARVEAYLPYPAPEVEAALGAPPSRLSVAVFAAGIGGAAGAYGLQWLLNAYLYPLDVGGRPPHFPLAFVPITFEMGVLFASLTAFAAVVVLGRMLRLWDPSREVEGIESSTGTGFWLEVDAPDEAAYEALPDLLRERGAIAVRTAEVLP